jgi:glycosyltransferase involved in cell wall biosynthesis
MNVCLVSHEYPPESARGGIGTQTWNKAERLTALGHTVHVVACAGSPGPALRSEDRDGVLVHRVYAPDLEVDEPQTYWLAYSWAVFRALRALEHAHSYDLINFPEYGGEGYVYQLDRTPWKWTPTVVQLHGPLGMLAEHIGWPAPGSRFWHVGTHMEETSVRLADGLMASSANIADYAAERYGVDRVEIDVVHCGIDPELFSPAPAPPGGDSDRPVVLFVGNLAENKGLVTTFEAVMRLRDAHPSVLLRLLGTGDDDLASKLRRDAAAAGAADILEFAGFVGDRSLLPDYYRAAYVFCAPSHYECGVANTFVEAMSCGLPVVAASTGGTPEAVIDGESGILVPSGDVAATAAALDRLLTDSQLRRRLGEGGRRRVVDYFAADKYVQRVLAAYEKTLERARESRGLLAEVHA